MPVAAAKIETRVPVDDPIVEFKRLLDAPVELVWECFTEIKHLQHWWGPNGFSITNHKIDIRPGGSWDFVMHGPDGRDYDNITHYTEVKKYERLVYGHGEPGKVDEFTATITFAREGKKTRVTMSMRFASTAARDEIIRQHNAVEGGQQTLGRLVAYLEQQGK